MSRSSGSLNDDVLFALSTRSLQDELRRRAEELGRPACGSGDERGSYNLSLHVWALFLILALSTIACSFPIIARRFPKLPIPHRFLFLSRHFGTGVLIATAFVHLLPTAFVSLTDPCLPPFWTEGYPASAGLVAMLAVLTVVGIEMFFATKGAAHSHGGEYGAIDQEHNEMAEVSTPILKERLLASRPGPKHLRHKSLKFFDSPAGSVEQFSSQRNGYQHTSMSLDADFSHGSIGNRKQEISYPHPESPELNERRTSASNISDSGSDHNDPEPDPLHSDNISRLKPTDPESHSPQPDAHEAQKLLLQCLLLEAGILFHSIFIGMALSVATGTPFIVLLVAISFHQTFEGLALGSRIAAIPSFAPSSPKPWLMALAYGTTTPFGQAIGLGVRNLYDPGSEAGLLMVGVMNAVSSGLLLFAGLVELLAEDFLSDKSYVALRGRKRLQACAAVVAGSLLMALVGAWA